MAPGNQTRAKVNLTDNKYLFLQHMNRSSFLTLQFAYMPLSSIINDHRDRADEKIATLCISTSYGQCYSLK